MAGGDVGRDVVVLSMSGSVYMAGRQAGRHDVHRGMFCCCWDSRFCLPFARLQTRREYHILGVHTVGT